MKLSKNWLQDYVDIQNADLFHTLSLHTSEVEEEIQIGHMPHVIVGHVLQVSAHPNADKLRVASVDTGEASPRTIVCGASNLAEGQKVAVATPGAVMPAGFTITVSSLRGVESEGMLCSEDELGLIDERQPGIMILPEEAPVGKPLDEYLETKDSVLDIENKSITNRPDLFGHYGIARECSVLFDLPLKPVSSDTPQLETTLPSIEVSIAKDTCSRYTAIKIEGCTPKESPMWLQRRLRAIGQTPKNSIVDVTNYIMLDLGLPIHAFDADHVGDHITVGYLDVPEEEHTTLDGKTRSIDNNTLLILSKKKPIAIAGIMGLESSAVQDTTESIVLESACFHGGIIRKGELSLNLRTEASIRFEKYLDPELCRVALEKATALILSIHPEAHIASGITDEYPTPLNRSVVHTSYSFLRKRIGNDFSTEFINNTLTRLGFTINSEGDNISITAPSWRSTGDISIPEDIVEELVRIYGYNAIKPTAPLVPLKPAPQKKTYTRKEELINMLAECGLAEVSTYSFYSKELHATFGLSDKNEHTPIQVLNPLSSEQEIMRTSISPQLATLAAKEGLHADTYGIFTIERVYLKAKNTIEEVSRIGIALSNEASDTSTKDAHTTHPLFHLKNIIERISAKKTVSLSFTPTAVPLPFLHPKRSTDVYMNGEYVGYIGELHPKVATEIDAKKTIVVSELDFLKVIEHWTHPTLKAYSQFPGADRDLSIIVEKSQEVGSIIEAIRDSFPHIQEVTLIDIFEGASVPEDKKSITLHLRIENMERTMTDDELLTMMNTIIDMLKKKYQAHIRGA